MGNICHVESCYLEFDIVPIILIWFACGLLVVLVIIMWCVVCCLEEGRLKEALQKFSYCPKACDYCHCTRCNRLMCMDNPATPCACEDCIDRVQASDPLVPGENSNPDDGGDRKKGSYKSCHFFPGCDECSKEPPELCLCETCHCTHCKKLLCEECECIDCTKRNEKPCHRMSKCKCSSELEQSTSTLPAESTSTPQASRLSVASRQEKSVPMLEIIQLDRTDSGKRTEEFVLDSPTPVAFADDVPNDERPCNRCVRKCCTRSSYVRFWQWFCSNIPWWHIYFVLMGIFNAVVRIVYGSNQGVLRDTPRVTYIDKLGRQVVYVDDIPVLEKSNYFQFILIIKALFWLAFTLSVGADVFFVKSDLMCDTSRDCYILDNNFDEEPITANCTEIVDNQKQTAVCYELVFDFTMASSAMGGLLTFTRVELVIFATLNTCLLKWSRKKSQRCFKCVIASVIIVTIIVIVILYPVFLHVEQRANLSPLRHAGRIIQFTGYMISVMMSVLIPWYHLVDPDFCTKKEKEKCT